MSAERSSADEYLSRIEDLIGQRDKLQQQVERQAVEREGIFLALAEWCALGQSPTEAIRRLREFLEYSERIRQEQGRRLRECEAEDERRKLMTPGAPAVA